MSADVLTQYVVTVKCKVMRFQSTTNVWQSRAYSPLGVVVSTKARFVVRRLGLGAIDLCTKYRSLYVHPLRKCERRRNTKIGVFRVRGHPRSWAT